MCTVRRGGTHLAPSQWQVFCSVKKRAQTHKFLLVNRALCDQETCFSSIPDLVLNQTSHVPGAEYLPCMELQTCFNPWHLGLGKTPCLRPWKTAVIQWSGWTTADKPVALSSLSTWNFLNFAPNPAAPLPPHCSSCATAVYYWTICTQC